tara:strand:- start:306 stop:686 length:381 start_codon:yes stop_codon:yes gene_type:complete
MSEFNLEIISPDQRIFSGSTSEVIIPCYEGLITILKDHIPLITFLRPGFIEIDNDKQKFFVEEGTVEFSKNKLLILTTSAENLKDLTNEKKNQMLKDAEEKFLDNKLNDKQKYILSYKIETLKQIN